MEGWGESRRRLASALVALGLLAVLTPPASRAQPRHIAYLPVLRQLTTPKPPPEPLRWVGEIGGEASALAVQPGAAYLGEGHRLVVVDLSDAEAPRRVREIALHPGSAKGMLVDRGRLYVAAGAGGLRILDVSDPLAPVALGALDTTGEARAVAVAGGMAYVADGPSGLRLIDITNPFSPRLVHTLDTVFEANDLSVVGGVAYLAIADLHSAGMLIVDVSDPLRPKELADVATRGEAYAIAAREGYAYLADLHAGLHVFDVARPDRPRLVATFDGMATGVWIHDDRAYVTSERVETEADIVVVDVTDPTNPRVDEEVHVDGTVHDLAWLGGHLYAATNSAGLESFEKAPGQPMTSTAKLDRPGFWAKGMAISGDRAYVHDGEGVIVVDIADPATPRWQGRAPEPKSFSRIQAASGDYAFGTTSARALIRLDASEATAPEWSAAPDLPADVRDMAMEGSYGYVLDGRNYLRLLDLSSPARARGSAELKLETGPMNLVDVSATHAFVSASSGILHAVSIVDPLKPRLVSSLGGLGVIDDLAVDSHHAYLADRRGNLRIVSVSDPTQMSLLVTLPWRENVTRVAAAGARLLVGDLGDELTVIDIAHLAAPRVLGNLDHVGPVYQLLAEDGRFFVADGAGGLQIYEGGSPP